MNAEIICAFQYDPCLSKKYWVTASHAMYLCHPAFWGRIYAILLFRALAAMSEYVVSFKWSTGRTLTS